jgi:hypothetical protein
MVTVVYALLQELSTPNHEPPLFFDGERCVFESNALLDQHLLNNS